MVLMYVTARFKNSIPLLVPLTDWTKTFYIINVGETEDPRH